MDNMEKVEKIRELADVSYEEAKTALEENNWEVLDAMVALERQGKTKTTEQVNSSIGADVQCQNSPIMEREMKKPRRGAFRAAIRKIIRICRENSFHVTRKEEEIIKMPVMLLVVVMFFFWELLLPVMIISMFFNIRYHFDGKDDLNGANVLMDSAGDMADRMKAEFIRSEEVRPEEKADEMTEVNAEEETEVAAEAAVYEADELKKAETDTIV